MTTLVIAMIVLVLIVFLNRALDISSRWNDQPSGAVRIDVAGELLAATPDEEAHRRLHVVQLQDAESGLEQRTTVPIVLNDSPAFVPRRGVVAFINPAAGATMTMVRGSELPAGFRFVAPGVIMRSTTAAL